jgi:hypothetical protein
MEHRGRVVRKLVGKGSKSEREAVVLRTETGDHILRRLGGNAFRDPELEKLVGKDVVCEGDVEDGTLLATSCRPVI